MGGTPPTEHYLAYRKARKVAEAAGLTVGIAFVGEYFTGLEMAGFLVTLSRLDDKLEQLIRAKVDTCMFKMTQRALKTRRTTITIRPRREQ